MSDRLLLLLSLATVLLAVMYVSSAVAAPHEVATRKHGQGQWELLVDGRPFFVQGVVYNFYTVGDDPSQGTLRDWSVLDSDGNGKVDVAYDSWVDRNLNARQDPDEPAVGMPCWSPTYVVVVAAAAVVSV